MSSPRYNSTAYKEQIGNFDLVDEITEQLLSDDMNDKGDDIKIISVNHNQSLNTMETNQTVLWSTELFNVSKLIKIDLLDEIPNYLSKTNQSFQTKIYSIQPTTNNVEKLRSIAILMHQIICTDMIHSLWEIYRKSGIGELDITLTVDELDKKIWPKQILSFIEQYKLKDTTTTTTINDDHICLRLVNDYLRKLKEKHEAYRQELRLQTSCLSDYTANMEECIQKFIEEELSCLRIEIDCQIALVKYSYMDRILQQQYLMQKPTDIQIQLIEELCQLKYNQETIKHEINLFKEKLLIHLSIHPFDSQSIVQSPLINCIPSPSLQQQLYQQYQTIIEHIRTKKLNIYMKSIEEQMDYCEKHFNNEMHDIWKINRTLPQNQQLTASMLNLIEQRLINITARIECIYKFKNQLFDIKLNIH